MKKISWPVPYWILVFNLFSCKQEIPDREKGLPHITDTKVMQYAVEGKILYEKYCANCHQKDGSGLGQLIPPLNQSDYMLEDVGRTVRIIKYGQSGPIIVNGIEYNQNMPANPQLTNIEIAKISTYLYNIWGAKKGVIDALQVEKFLSESGN